MSEIIEGRVLLTLDGTVIVAKEHTYVDGDPVGVAVECEDGTSRLYAEEAHPTYKKYYNIDVPDAADFETKRQAVVNATGWTFDEEFPWLETDENGDAVPGTDTEERLTESLNSKVYDLNLLEGWGERTASEYAPGFELMASLSEEEVAALGLREGNLGGPASSVPCVVTSATIETLNQTVASKRLPFVFVEDD